MRFSTFCFMVLIAGTLLGCEKNGVSSVDSVSTDAQTHSDLPAPHPSALGYTSQYILLNDLKFHYVQAGSGKLIVFLHGFPYFGESWDKLLRPLSLNYKVVAPDNRGYAFSQKPSETKDYRIDQLVNDVYQLLEVLSPDKQVVLVGHDWGGVLAWGMAQQHPNRISKVIVINAPPYNVFLKMLQESDSQREASKYIGKLSGWMSKLLFAIRGPDLIWSSLEKLHTDGHVDEDFKHLFLDAWSQPGAAQGATNWYKANIPEFDSINEQTYWPSQTARVTVPSMLIWSKHDKAFTNDTFRAIPNFVDDITIRELDTDSHAPFLDHPDWVLNNIEQFLMN